MKKLLQDKTLLKNILLIFLLVQPFLDFYLLYEEPIISWFKFSPSTIIRVLSISILFGIVFFNNSRKKGKIIIISYLSLVGLYFIVHQWNAGNFVGKNLEDFRYSTLSEIFYFLRMLLPLAMIIITYKLEFKKKDVMKIVLGTSLIISLVIVISNIFCISLTSYAGNKTIQGNIFTWFMENKNGILPNFLSGRGWFYTANQISGLMCLLLPITAYFTLSDYSIKKLGILFLQILAMIIIGTRVASLGWIFIVVMMLIIYLFMGFIKKEIKCNIKVFLKVTACIIIGSLILIKSPVVDRSYDVDFLKKEQDKQSGIENLDELDSLVEKLSYTAIHEEYYIDIYPHDKFEDFWTYIIKLPFYERSGNRNLEKLVTKDIFENNENKLLDSMFGMSFTRMRNGNLYIESDFVAHYYTVGIVGIILFLCPFVGILLYKGVKSLIKFKEEFTFFRVTLFASLGITLLLSVFSGHIMDELIVTLYLGFICGLILKKESWKDNEKN